MLARDRDRTTDPDSSGSRSASSASVRELRRLVEEQHTAVGQRHRPGPRHPGAAADDRRGRRGVVGRLKGRPGRAAAGPRAAARPPSAPRSPPAPASRSSGGRIVGSRCAEQRLARSGRSVQQEVVAAGRGHLHGPAPLVLPDHLGEVDAERVSAAPARPAAAHRARVASPRSGRRRARAGAPRRSPARPGPARPRRRSRIGTTTCSRPGVARGQDARAAPRGRRGRCRPARARRCRPAG